MKTATAVLGLVLCAGIVHGQGPPATKPATPEALRKEVEALRPDRHAWREIAWKTCPLEALKEARDKNKPVIAWVFLGLPTDERC